MLRKMGLSSALAPGKRLGTPRVPIHRIVARAAGDRATAPAPDDWCAVAGDGVLAVLTVMGKLGRNPPGSKTKSRGRKGTEGRSYRDPLKRRGSTRAGGQRGRRACCHCGPTFIGYFAGTVAS
jgi:hypothetical protein